MATSRCTDWHTYDWVNVRRPDGRVERVYLSHLYMCVYSRDNGDLDVRIEQIGMIGVRLDWEMKAWRFNPLAPGAYHGFWKLGGTRTGYVSADSMSTRIFTNCKPGWWVVTVKYADRYTDLHPGFQSIIIPHGNVTDPKPSSRPVW